MLPSSPIATSNFSGFVSSVRAGSWGGGRSWMDLFYCSPLPRSNQWRLRGSVTTPSWTMRLPERSSGVGFHPVSLSQAQQCRLLIADDDPRVRAAYKGTS